MASTYFHDLLMAQLEHTAQALDLAHRALAVTRCMAPDASTADLAREIAILEHQANRVRQQLGIEQIHAVH